MKGERDRPTFVKISDSIPALKRGDRITVVSRRKKFVAKISRPVSQRW